MSHFNDQIDITTLSRIKLMFNNSFNDQFGAKFYWWEITNMNPTKKSYVKESEYPNWDNLLFPSVRCNPGANLPRLRNFKVFHSFLSVWVFNRSIIILDRLFKFFWENFLIICIKKVNIIKYFKKKIWKIILVFL